MRGSTLFSRRQFLFSTAAAAAIRFPFTAPAESALQLGPRSCVLHAEPLYAPFLAPFLKQVEPGHDAFITELYAAAIDDRLQSAARRLLVSVTAGCRALAGLCVPQFEGPAFDRSEEESPSGSLGPLRLSSFRHASRATSPAQMDVSLRHWLAELTTIHLAEFQIDGITMLSESPRTAQVHLVFDICGTKHDDSRQERTGTWTVAWEQQGPRWMIRSWAAGPELRSELSGPGFRDTTERWMRNVPTFAEQMGNGANYWRTVLDGATGIDIYGNNGIAAGDYDGDGRDDLYICQPAGLPNRLYRNRGDGSFEDVTEKAGVGVLDGTSSALFVDLENTGRQDLIVVRSSGPLLFVNQGEGRYELRPDAFQFRHPPQGTFTAVAAADYDRDGRVDLYFCLYSYYQGLSEYQFPEPYYDARNGPANFLLHNSGGYMFEDVTERAGMNSNNNRYSFACSWEDYDNNGAPDLYVANDFGSKNLYRNRGDGTFEDVAESAGVLDLGAGMSVSWFDGGSGGSNSLYVADMWSAAGLRVTSQAQFLPGVDERVRRAYHKHADGNSLFHAHGEQFDDATDAAGVRLGRWSWSADAFDPFHAGQDSLYVANGFISGPIRDNLSSFFWRQVVARSLTRSGDKKSYADSWSAVNEFIRSDHSWSGRQRNNLYCRAPGSIRFVESAAALGLDFIEDSRSFALADLDGDGRLEIVLKNRSAPQIRVLENQLSEIGRAITLTLRGRRSNRDAIGARVRVFTAHGQHTDTVRAGSGFLAQHSKTLHFGVGSEAASVSFEVTWPSGTVQHFSELAPDRHYRLVEGDAAPTGSPFTPRGEHAPIAPGRRDMEETLPESPSTWLVESIEPPSLGGPVQLQDGRGHPQFLLFLDGGCTASALDECRKYAGSFQQAGVRVIVLGKGFTKTPALPGGMLFVTPDEATLGVYDIFYRYLFERRRDMPLPTGFLLDREARVVRVYSGISNMHAIPGDAQNIPASQAARLAMALPFKGEYYGQGMHHNSFTYGVAYLQFGFHEQAQRAFTEATERMPDYAPAYYNLGLIYLNQNQLHEAQHALERATELDPTSADAWNNLGVVYGQQNQYAAALPCFKKALVLQPAHLLALQNIVKLYEFQGRAADALDAMQTAVQHAPADPEFRIAYGTLLLSQHEQEAAAKQFEAALAADSKSVEALNGLGVIRMQQGRNAEAIQLFEKCTQIAPDFDRPYLNLAMLRLQAGQKQQALTLLSGFLAAHPDNDDVRQALHEIERAP